MGWLPLFAVAAAHIFYTPFTKVEESFNIQAVHDIIYLKQNFSQYDHHEFPGVVPRTFIGPLILAIMSSPFAMLIQFLQFPKLYTQYVVRLVLAFLVALSWNSFRKTICAIYGRNVAFWFTSITLSQFHFIFYMSRTLPNILVLPVVLLALSAWLQKHNVKFIWLAGVSILIFRAELLLFFGLLIIYNLICNQISLKSFFQNTVLAGLVILSFTISIDSFFWKKLLWPEGAVLWYNTVLNKSSDWGTSPFLWYFYSAIPRAMGFSVIFVPLGLYFERRLRAVSLCALIFVLLYSFLPHKELRFIIYIFPVLNLCAACYCNTVLQNLKKSKLFKIKAVFCVGHIFCNVVFTIFLILVSSTNYPGGEAIKKLHYLKNVPKSTVHICNLVAQTGFTRFQEMDGWDYNKTEHLKYNEHVIKSFSYLLVEDSSLLKEEVITLQEHFNSIDHVDCFSHISIHHKYYKPINIETKQCVTIWERRQQFEELKELDYEGLRRLALNNKKEFRSSKVMRRIVEEYYNTERLKKLQKQELNLKNIEIQKEIQFLIDSISKQDLTKYCDLHKIGIKECLKLVIDSIEE